MGIENKTEYKPPEAKKENIQTYVGDMSKALEENKGGLIKKIIQEQEEREMRSNKFSPQSRRNKLFMAMSIILVFLALAVVGFFLFKKSSETVPVVQQFTPLIFLDKTNFLEIGGVDKEGIVKQILDKVLTTKVKQDGVEGIYLTESKKVIGLRRFSSLIKSSLIAGEEALVNDNFLIGTIRTQANTNSEGGDLFVLLKARSFVDIFPIMRAWEQKMFYDMYSFFGSTFDASTKYLSTENFKDGVIENKNARILYDKDNKIVMMYIFADENSVIITNSEAAAGEIILRLSSSQIKR
jgi:hypothetical protein